MSDNNQTVRSRKSPAGGPGTAPSEKPADTFGPAAAPAEKPAETAGRRTRQKSSRLETLDLLRGLTIISMILYHGMWDFIYLSQTGSAMTGLRTWYEGPGGHLWQQSICRTFILLSGFCVPFSRHIFRRGLQVSAGGFVVSTVTLLFMYEDRVVFGVLTFLGMAMLLAGLIRNARGCLRKTAGAQGGGLSGPVLRAWYRGTRSRELTALILCLILFYCTRWVNRCFLRFGPGLEPALPDFLFVSAEGQATLAGRAAGLVLTGLGFPMQDFFSTDYFSLVPWIFLFFAGICLHGVMAADSFDHGRTSVPRKTTGGTGQWPAPDKNAGNAGQRPAAGTSGGMPAFSHPLMHLEAPVLNWMGRHSLLIYMLHQPVLYLLISVLF